LFTDIAFLSASSDEDDEQNIKKLYKGFKSFNPKLKFSQFQNFLFDLSSEERVQSCDIAKCLLQGILLIDTSTSNPKSVMTNQTQQNLLKLNLLQPANLERCVETIQRIRQKYPKIIPRTISDFLAGKLLGILNNNQMELERYGGTGLFLNGCLCEHSCLPNCSYSTEFISETETHQFTLVAIRDIHPGRVSLLPLPLSLSHSISLS
jgi:hypothetical protein